MTDLTRIFELLGTSEKVHLEFTKIRPGIYQIRATEGDDVHASGTGVTLEQACACFVKSALHVGLMSEPVPPTEPVPAKGEQ